MGESFIQAAGRHLYDANLLLDEKRWDNAVYLAGYVVECTFKVLVEQYFQADRAAVKKYGHDLVELEGKAVERLRVMYPALDRQLPSSRINSTVLAQDHPDRRYAESGLWSEAQAKEAVNRAAEIYRDLIIKMVLDGIIPSKEI
jgi:HEPN domain-containing protein